MKRKPLQKLYVVRKYVWADTAKTAMRKERDQAVDDVWLDEGWKALNSRTTDAIGFNLTKTDEY